MALESGFTSAFSLIGSITGVIRNLINSIAADYFSIVLLGLSLLAGWYLAKRYPKIEGYWTIALYGIIIFLLLRFV